MKTIYLIRHAKSDWGVANLSDFDRPLNNRGKRDAPFMGKQLKELSIYPDCIVSSPAKRALQTTKLICSEINYPFNKVEFIDSIYDSSLKNLTQVLNGLSDNYKNVFLVGHNPGLTELSDYLTEDYLDNISTCGIVKIELEINDWKEIIQGIGIKRFFIYPKLYN
jgi:phosphohistidine phosphatase